MTKYRFDQIAYNITEKKKPSSDDNKHYIGLEHLDRDSLMVTRWGADVAPIGEKLLMKKGDVLFGKRRAYQKKVAIAPFDGIFSAHGMVLRPKEDIITKEYFPFFIKSDYFLDAAIKISVGSLSPTVNWKDLQKLEFDLPPIEEQKRLAEILWAAENLKQKEYVASENLSQLKHSLASNFFTGNLYGILQVEKKTAVNLVLKNHDIVKNNKKWLSPLTKSEIPCSAPNNWKWVKLGEICTLIDGTKKENLSLPYLDVNYLRGLSNATIHENGEFVSKNSSLILVDGENSGEVFNVDTDGYLGSTFKILKLDEMILKEYVVLFIDLNQKLLKNTKTGSAIPHLNKVIFYNLLFPISSYEEQQALVNLVSKIEKLRIELMENMIHLKDIQHHILNKQY